jgi:ribokinase
MAIKVFGSINEDLVIQVDRRPSGGETVLGSTLVVGQGGKGANQAAAAASAGGTVQMVGAVGDDAAGSRARNALSAAGVDVGSVFVCESLPTGTAVVTLTPDGENSIVVIPGANEALDASLVDRLAPVMSPEDVVIVQTEIGSAGADQAARQAAGIGARVVLNAAPVVTLSADTLSVCNPLVVNEHEARDIAGTGPTSVGSDALAEVVRLATGAQSVIVTLGSSGCIVSDAEGQHVIPGEKVPVADSTGAGDVFVGTLAAHLAAGDSLHTAATAANAAAARAVGWAGARQPTFTRTNNSLEGAA